MRPSLHWSRHRFRPRRAVAAVELAITMPLVALLLVSLLEVGRLVQINMILCNAAREGARSASTGVNTYAGVQTTVINYLTNAGVTNQTGLTVKIYDVTQSNTGPTFDPSTADYLDQLQITVTLPFNNVQLAPLHILPTDPNTSIIGQAVWFSNQNHAYPGNITPPQGN
jgi:Flp pilus assembly protein TadG